jgi:hypothetical protein
MVFVMIQVARTALCFFRVSDGPMPRRVGQGLRRILRGEALRHTAKVTAAKVFIPIWLVAALVILWMGTRAGYSVVEELPIFLLIFAAPAAVALFIWWQFA